jgi:Ca2+-binding RTX toxin-like protein
MTHTAACAGREFRMEDTMPVFPRIIIYGTSADDVIFGDVHDDELSDRISALDGNDYVFAGFGDDTVWGGNGHDSLYGDDGNDHLYGDAGNDRLYGRNGNDALHGGSGDDELDGGAGADTMAGGTDNDIYWVDYAGDRVTENAGEGRDGVISSIDYTLDPNVENLWLSGGAVTATGNDLDNQIYGNSANNTLVGNEGRDTLDGRAGADIMIGGDGGDTYYVDDAGDELIEADGQGLDWVYSSVSYTFDPHVEVLAMLPGTGNINGIGNDFPNQMFGNEAANRLEGWGGNDWLNGGAGADILVGGNGLDFVLGGAGADTLTGGAGSDRFRFDTVGDSAVGAPDQIVDFVSSRFSAESDKIDLSFIDASASLPGDQAFVFIGNNNAFYGAGQARCNGGFVEGDVNGDLVADFRIQVFQSDNLLIAADFIL